MKTILGAALLSTLCICSTAQAATLNSIRYQNGGVGDPACGQGIIDRKDGAGDISVAYTEAGPGGCKMAINASVFGGGIGIFASTSTVPGGTFSARAQVAGFSTMTDIFITPMAGYTGPFVVPVSLKVEISGNLRAEVRENAQFVRSAASGVTATVSLSGANGLGGTDFSFDDGRFDDQVGITQEGFDTKVLIGSIFTSINQDIRRPMSVGFSFSGNAGVLGGTDSFASATLNAMNTMSFSKSGPAFILPDGLTINAPELNIFNNQWIDPRVVTPPVSAVPLPAGLPLLLAGLGSLAWLRRKTNA
jgi:hypothetical protein